MPEKLEFISKLVFEKEPDWCCIEPYIVLASHPEIAYQLAMAKGQEGPRRQEGEQVPQNGDLQGR